MLFKKRSTQSCVFTTPWGKRLLIEALEILSWPAVQQIAWVKETKVHVDELGLCFDDAYSLLRGKDEYHERFDVDREQMKHLAEIDRLLNGISGEEKSDYWTEKGIGEKTEWQRIRGLAGASLSVFKACDAGEGGSKRKTPL